MSHQPDASNASTASGSGNSGAAAATSTPVEVVISADVTGAAAAVSGPPLNAQATAVAAVTPCRLAGGDVAAAAMAGPPPLSESAFRRLSAQITALQQSARQDTLLKDLLFEEMRRLIDIGGPIVEIGAGGGILKFLLGRMKNMRREPFFTPAQLRQIIETEYDMRMVATRNRLGERIMQLDAQDLLRAFGDKQCFSIVGINVLDVLPTAVLGNVLASAARTLVPGGVIVHFMNKTTHQEEGLRLIHAAGRIPLFFDLRGPSYVYSEDTFYSVTPAAASAIVAEAETEEQQVWEAYCKDPHEWWQEASQAPLSRRVTPFDHLMSLFRDIRRGTECTRHSLYEGFIERLQAAITASAVLRLDHNNDQVPGTGDVNVIRIVRDPARGDPAHALLGGIYDEEMPPADWDFGEEGH